MDQTVWIGAGAGLIAGAVAVLLVVLVTNRQRKNAGRDLLDLARKEADRLKKSAINEGREEWAQQEKKRKEALKSRERKLTQKERQLKSRETEIRAQGKAAQETEMQLKLKEKLLDHKEEEQATLKKELKELVEQERARIESLASLSMEEARQRLMDMARETYESEAATIAAEIKGNARENAGRLAREIITTAVEKHAAETASETTIKEVAIPNNRIKGMVIGREGRNIKCFEAVSGCKMIVDETPDTILISSFDPVRREVARVALESLIRSRNFSPRTVQEAMKKAANKVENQMREAATRVLKDLKLKVHPTLLSMLGRLKYRTSYGQNVLDHSAEVAKIAGGLAAELGMDVMLARRAGLLHDIGKADSNGSEKSHVTLGVEVCRRVREHPVVINAVMAHHQEAPPIDPISELVTAADILSSARPGSRRDSVDSYTKRVETLEGIADSFPGVNRVYALYAGREIRVIVEGDKVDDGRAEKLSSDIATKISEEMEFPGAIKVVVIREARGVAMAS